MERSRPYVTVFAEKSISVEDEDEPNIEVQPWVDPGPVPDPFVIFFASQRELLSPAGFVRLSESAAQAAERHAALRVRLNVRESVDAPALQRLRVVGEEVGVPAVELTALRSDG